ncbi:MAG TPA: hypothetical protein VIQ49_22735 [Williamsia sp.]
MRAQLIYLGAQENCRPRITGVERAAVVGVPDSYRWETVKAFVSLRADVSVTTDELIAFTQERLAAYEVPKAATGKILRRQLRETSS